MPFRWTSQTTDWAAEVDEAVKWVQHVTSSGNHVLLLSRQVLQRPWVLVELAAAHSHQKNMLVVMVEYIDKSKQFRFPLDLDEAINDWETYIAATSKAASKRPRRLPLNIVRRGRGSVEVAKRRAAASAPA